LKLFKRSASLFRIEVFLLTTTRRERDSRERERVRDSRERERERERLRREGANKWEKDSEK